ncbi:glycohydrolase toxin TNT-related protein, partial [Escherichia coli]|nr:glycohydrolase toxin TNT-related protein [Escherichia coli]
GGSFGDKFQGNMPGGMISAGGHSGHAEGTTQAAVAEGTITIRDRDNQKQNLANLSRDPEHANDSISPIFDKEKEQRRLQTVGLISDIGSQVADIARTQGELNALKAAKEASGETLPANATEKQRQEYLAKLRDTQAYRNEMAKYGTGSEIQRGIQAATAALQGLAGGNMAGALAGASAPELANIIGHHAGIDDNTAAKAIAHAILGGVTAALQDNSAAAGAIGAGTGEVIASAIAKSLYPDVDPSKLTEEQKQTVSTLATLSAGMAGGIASGDVAGAAAGAGAGKNVVENNYLSRDEAAEKASLEYKLKNDLLSGDEKTKAEARLSQLDETDKARDAAIAEACPPGSKGSGACGALVGPAQKALVEYGENVTYSLLYKDLYPQDAKNLETVLQGLDAGSITRDQAITEIAKASGVSWETAASRYDTAMQLQAVTAALISTYGVNGLSGQGKSTSSATSLADKVKENITLSQKARESSNFGQFSKAEGVVQENLGIWPPNRGAYGPVEKVTLPAGTVIDRYGYPGGSFVSPIGVPFEQRALPSSHETTKPYFQYEILKPIDDVSQGKILPWFGQKGQGTQYELPKPVQWYLDKDYIKKVDK